MSDFHGMIENVLGVTVAEMEPPQQLGDFEVHRGQAGLMNRFLAQAHNRFVHLRIDLSDNFFDARRMDAPIGDETNHGFPSNFAPHGIKAGEQHRTWGVINQDGHAGSSFEGANIASLTANNAAFDFVALEGNGGGSVFESVLARVALN